MSVKSAAPRRDRRAFLKASLASGAVVAAGGLGAAPVAAQARKSTFVLIHGAWHGGWCWQRVTPLLRAAGHEVYAPTLTGLGEREHLASRSISLNTHISDVSLMMQMEDLKDVILVGHSYAGFVATGVADRVASRVKRLVYFDAFVPEDGKMLADYAPPDRREAFVKMGEAGFYDPFPLEPFGVTKPEDLAWAKPRIRKQPARTFLQPLKLKNGPPRMALAYVRCIDPAYPQFIGFAQRLRNDPNWKYSELTGGHDAMISNPKGTAEALLALA